MRVFRPPPTLPVQHHLQLQHYLQHGHQCQLYIRYYKGYLLPQIRPNRSPYCSLSVPRIIRCRCRCPPLSELFGFKSRRQSWHTTRRCAGSRACSSGSPTNGGPTPLRRGSAVGTIGQNRTPVIRCSLVSQNCRLLGLLAG